MARSFISINYKNRLIDLSLFPELSTPGINANMSIGPNSKVITGPSKACQRFLIVFLTKLGSDASRPTMGTRFPSMLQTGMIFISPGQVEQIFNVEALAAITYLRSLPDINTRSLDEIVTEVRLTNYSISRTLLTIEANVSFADGSTLPMVIPTTWQP